MNAPVSYSKNQLMKMNRETVEGVARYCGATEEEIQSMNKKQLVELTYRLQVEADGFETANEEQSTAVSEDEESPFLSDEVVHEIAQHDPIDHKGLTEKIFKTSFFMKTVEGSRQKFTFTDMFGKRWTIEKTSDGKRWQGLDIDEGAVFADTRKEIAMHICSVTATSVINVCDAHDIKWQDFSFDDIVAFSKPTPKATAQELENWMME